MSETVSVRLIPIKVEADPDVIAQRTEVARRLVELDQIPNTPGEPGTEVTVGWTAHLSTGVVDLLGSDVETTADGRVVVTLVFEAGAVQIGDPPVERSDSPKLAVSAPNQRPRTTWGDPRAEDPRAGLPGWTPETTTTSVTTGPTPIKVGFLSGEHRIVGGVSERQT